MARLYGAHTIVLKPEVSGQEFERFVREEWRPANLPGIRTSILRGDRGERAGAYLMLFEFEDGAVRDRYWPPARGGDASEEWQRIRQRAFGTAEQRRVLDRLNALTAGIDEQDGVPLGPYTDWLAIGE
jgi:hypothetical protein